LLEYERNYDVITDEEPLSKQTLGRKFIPVSIGSTSVKIHHETWELWSKIKWHVFLWTTVYTPSTRLTEDGDNEIRLSTGISFSQFAKT